MFTGGNIGKDNTFVIEYNPRKAAFLCPRIEVEIIDNLSSKLNGKAGYEANIKIYNPSPTILSMIASGMSYFTGGGDIFDYYSGKVQVSLYAGYFVPKEPTGAEESKIKEKAKEANEEATKSTNIVLKDDELLCNDGATYGQAIFENGFVNNSFYVHKGTDNILTLTCHNINTTAMQYQQMKPVGNAGNFVPVFDWDVKKEEPRKGFPTFDQTFKYFATKYADYWYPPSKRGILASTNGGEALPLDSLERGTTNPQWMKVLYVNSLNDVLTVKDTGGALEDVKQNESLRIRATDASIVNRIRTDKFYTNGASKQVCLTDLCAFGGENLGWEEITDAWGYIVYAVYPRDSYKSTVPLDTDGVVKIINFQNLLEPPTASASGCLNVKMWLNKECRPNRYLALVLDSTYEGNPEESGILNINKLNFTSNGNQLIVPLGGSGSNAAVSTTQLSTSMAISALAQYQDCAAKNGYMFNVGFCINRVTHKLSTHGKDWTTTVQTVPMMTGVKK